MHWAIDVAPSDLLHTSTVVVEPKKKREERMNERLRDRKYKNVTLTDFVDEKNYFMTF